jgi:hypothetical protein
MNAKVASAVLMAALLTATKTSADALSTATPGVDPGDLAPPAAAESLERALDHCSYQSVRGGTLRIENDARHHRITYEGSPAARLAFRSCMYGMGYGRPATEHGEAKWDTP